MREERKARSLMDYLAEIKDPRGRRGRRYRLSALLAILILAALYGFARPGHLLENQKALGIGALSVIFLGGGVRLRGIALGFC